MIKFNNQTIVTAKEIFVADLEVANGKISKIIKKKKQPNLNNILIPCFVDIHTHGGYGFSFNDLESDQFNVKALCHYLDKVQKEGIGSVFATTVTTKTTNLSKIYTNLLKAKQYDKNNIIKGWHIEGPFISPLRPGAHNPKLIVPLDNKALTLLQSFKNIKKRITIACEYQNNAKYVKPLSKVAAVSLGHSIANAQQTKQAIKDGATHITHMYNAMVKFEHRDLTIVNEALNNHGVYIELICDGQHVHQQVIKETAEIVGFDRLIVITDSLSCKGLNNGKYKLGDMTIYKNPLVATLSDKKTIAGSIQTYLQQIRNFMNYTNCNIQQIVAVSSANAIKSLNLPQDFVVGAPARFIRTNAKMTKIETFVF